jgi:hypothetical protein
MFAEGIMKGAIIVFVAFMVFIAIPALIYIYIQALHIYTNGH